MDEASADVCMRQIMSIDTIACANCSAKAMHSLADHTSFFCLFVVVFAKVWEGEKRKCLVNRGGSRDYIDSKGEN